MKTVAQLPSLTADQLRELYINRVQNHAALYAYVYALRRHGWPLRAIAEPLGVSRNAVHKWTKIVDTDPTLQKSSDQIFVPKLPPLGRGSKVKVKKIKKRLSTAQAQELTALAASASRLTRWTRKDDPIRQDARRYAELLTHYVDEEHIPTTDIAKSIGVSRRAIMQRVEKQRREAVQ